MIYSEELGWEGGERSVELGAVKSLETGGVCGVYSISVDFGTSIKIDDGEYAEVMYEGIHRVM
jgi:hypothetical protein